MPDKTETPTPKLVPYRVLAGQHSRNEKDGRKVYVPGDTILLPEKHGLGKMVERIHSGEGKEGKATATVTPTPAETPESTPPDTVDTEDISAADLIALIPEYEDIQQLQELRREEKEGKNRTTVLAAIEKQIKKLRG